MPEPVVASFLPAPVNLAWTVGDDVIFQFTIVGQNLGAGTGVAQVRRGLDPNSELLGTFDVALANASSNTSVTLELPRAQNNQIGGGYWDLEITAGGDRRTWMAGTVTINNNVTLGV